MFLLGRCPRCHGDLYTVADHYGGYVACLQCGHHLSVMEEVALGLRLNTAAMAVVEDGPTAEPVAAA